MDIIKHLVWCLVFDDTEQSLYVVERPTFSTASGSVQWNPIHIELPVNMLLETKEWIENPKLICKDISLICHDVDNNELEHWDIQNAAVKSVNTQKSRNFDVNVVHVVFNFKHAQRKWYDG